MQDWLQQQFPDGGWSIEPASADASFRRYFRVDAVQGCRIIMDAPPEKENCEPFAQVAALMHEAGLDAPEIRGDARLQGFSAELPALGVKLTGGDFLLRGEADGQARITGQVTSGSGQLRVEGSLNLRDGSSPLELSLRGENVTVIRDELPEIETYSEDDAFEQHPAPGLGDQPDV